MSTLHFPESLADFTPGLLSALLSQRHPGTVVQGFDVVDSRSYGDGMVSTAARARLDLHYSPGSGTQLPARMMLKRTRGEEAVLVPLYSNEARLYYHLRTELPIEAPQCYGAAWGAKTTEFALLLEDLGQRGARFPNVLETITIAQLESLLDTLATLHAHYWHSPRFATDLAWLETHTSGAVCGVMNGIVPLGIQHEVDTQAFKTELVRRLGTTASKLLAGLQAVHRHQSSLPQTLLHGDSHLGNTYFTGDGKAGLLDWQLTVRGYCMHDISYVMTTSLAIDLRRSHERALLQRYRDRLVQLGVRDAPSFDSLWIEYRRAVIWGVYIGWLTTPVVNYGWEINVINLLRLTTAYEDHGTAQLVAALG